MNGDQFTRARWAALLFGTCVFAALAQDPEVNTDRALGGHYAPFKDLAPDQTRLVFYRPAGDGLGVITLHVEGRYHTSLQNGAFSTLCLARDSVSLQAQPGRKWTRADASREVSQNVVMSGGQTLFVRLSDALSTRPRMDVMPANVATNEVQNTREQTHSLSRVALAKPCQSNTAPSLAFAPHVVALSAQAVKNPDELAQMLGRLELQYSGFKSVSLHMVGYAYGLGSEASNDSVSKDLASEVQRYFLLRSRRFEPVTSEGRGNRDRASHRGPLVSRVEIGITVSSN